MQDPTRPAAHSIHGGHRPRRASAGRDGPRPRPRAVRATVAPATSTRSAPQVRWGSTRPVHRHGRRPGRRGGTATPAPPPRRPGGTAAPRPGRRGRPRRTPRAPRRPPVPVTTPMTTRWNRVTRRISSASVWSGWSCPIARIPRNTSSHAAVPARSWAAPVVSSGQSSATMPAHSASRTAWRGCTVNPRGMGRSQARTLLAVAGSGLPGGADWSPTTDFRAQICRW